MTKTIVITQPTYLPWIGYFDLAYQADIFVFLDSVQFEKQSWQSRNRIRDFNGKLRWLSIPIAKHSLATPIHEISTSPHQQDWRQRHYELIRDHLGKAPYWEQASELLIAESSAELTKLADVNISFIQATAALLGIETRFVRASELGIEGRRTDLLLNICSHFAADRYYSNAGSAVYLDESLERFDEIGVTVEYQAWEHPTYPQQGSGFVSHLSVIDGIAAVGAAEVSRMVGGDTSN